MRTFFKVQQQQKSNMPSENSILVENMSKMKLNKDIQKQKVSVTSRHIRNVKENPSGRKNILPDGNMDL